MMTEGPLHCPVCRAEFRATRECSRCGADLSMLMNLAEIARLCRIKAREAIDRCEFRTASAFVAKAQEMHATETGRRLLILTEWLRTEAAQDTRSNVQ